ncbi:MAG: HAMP domain-containing histidine kinase [Planctomycetes bacterium]|nr:HAMP domain-containing histidine kinase [Planctomycetota bacterium]
MSDAVPAIEIPVLTEELERKLAAADSQLVLYARDLKRTVDSEREKARALAAANERLQILDRLKMDFLAFISHELRTPLTAISIVEDLESYEDAGEREELMGIVRRGYLRLEDFIKKGLEYFELLAMGRVAAQEQVALDDLTHKVSGELPGLKDDSVDFRITTKGKSFSVQGNEAYLARMISVLLDNAVKFSPKEKRIRVKLNAVSDPLTLTVADRGQGFPPQLACELFQPFTIGDVSHHSKGTGLSLAVAKAIAEAHGGKLRAESRGLGTGAIFVAEIPANGARTESPPGTSL